MTNKASAAAWSVLLAAALGFIAPTLDAHDEYIPAVAAIKDDTAARLQAMDAAADAKTLEMIKVYEQEDFDVMRGVVYEPIEHATAYPAE